MIPSDNTNRMMRDILAQSDSLAAVVAHQTGDGRSSLEAAAKALREASRIVITGMGASLYGSLLLDHHLRAMGLNCVAVDCGELLHFGGDLLQGATVVMVSRSGETVELVRLLPQLRAQGVHVIGITNEPGTTLAREASLPVLINAGKDDAVALQSYTGTAMVSLLLASAVAGIDCAEQARAALATVPDLLASCTAGMGTFRRFLDGARAIYLLGRGTSLVTAQEGALLFNEASKLPSVSMSSGAFRHGPVEVVDVDFRAFLIASDPATAPLDDALRAFLRNLGGQIQTLASSGYFAPVLEVIPLQFAAYVAAESRGFTPGQFRYIQQVTTSETDF